MPAARASDPSPSTLSRLSVRDRWMLLAIGCVLMGILGLYLGSGAASAKHLLAQLTHDQSASLYPSSTENLSALMTAPAPHIPTWSGAGKHYLKQQWPVMRQRYHAEQLLSVLASQAQSPAQWGYRRFPNEYVLTLDPDHQRVHIWLRRKGFGQWQPYLVCSDAGSTQPLLDLKLCPSDKR